ncbi:dihydrofolate reductase family protein [Brevibacterium renqingii]|uniref:dihydrofolate reductase family protein n=1 Tax=Brevibacterium renqingii TaxID=2776916 RepID=UPI001AE08BDF|nr:dihydrofolate reductase family protein [Brevibacterium renqingii]
MSRIVYSLSTSLDGYIVDAEGQFDWSVPDEEVFALALEEAQGLSAHLLGRRLYETMVYWETADRDPNLDFAEAGFGRLWRALPKLVFSSTLTGVVGNSELAAEPLAEAVARLRSEHPDGEIGIGGAGLAAQAADLDLIDEYRIRVHPVLVGGGTPFFAHHGRHANLELLESRTFASQVIYLRYGVPR